MAAMTWSKTQIDKLGNRLRKADEPADDDLAGYQDMCERYEPALQVVVEAIVAQGFIVTTRFPKTAGTLIEKLKRDRSRLSTVHDVAGVRVVVDGDRDDQDDAARAIIDELGDQAECTLRDRREDPSAGYRALHVIAVVEGIPVEVQIRTMLQDGWANLMEKFADSFGRQVRYGDEPTNADEVIRENPAPVTPRLIRDAIVEVSDLIDEIERVAIEVKGLETTNPDDIKEVMSYLGMNDDDLEEQQTVGAVIDLVEERRLKMEKALATTMTRISDLVEEVAD